MNADYREYHSKQILCYLAKLYFPLCIFVDVGGKSIYMIFYIKAAC